MYNKKKKKTFKHPVIDICEGTFSKEKIRFLYSSQIKITK